MPTPGDRRAQHARRRCAFGIVISASHNLYEDNGIKFFHGNGGKLSDELEARIEAELEKPGVATRDSNRLGPRAASTSCASDYQRFCASTVPGGLDLTGTEGRGGLRQRCRIQGRAATARGPGRGRHSHRLLTERSEHQRWLRLHIAGPAAAHRTGRSAPPSGIALDGDGDRLDAGRSPRPHRRRRPDPRTSSRRPRRRRPARCAVRWSAR